MSYVSIQFILLLLLSSALYFLIPKKYRWIILLLTSIVFYVFNSKWLIFFLGASLISIYFSGIAIKKFTHKKKLILIISILFNLGLLIYLKYTGFLLDIFSAIIHTNFSFQTHLLLPMGISYYTLEAISYLVDVYYEKVEPEKNLAKLALFLLYFPYILEGPISRYKEMKKTLYDGKLATYNEYRKGLILILWGYFKILVIADRCAILINTVFTNHYTGLDALLAIILYTVQIYAEFSGCMDIVMGTSNLFGIPLKDNFNAPFFSETVEEFWRRWHITLGTWLKDYIFYPISLCKTNMKLILKSSKVKNPQIAKLMRVALPMFFVWITMGLWHGASMKYVIYGLYYYIIMLFEILFVQPSNNKFRKIMGIIRTTLFVLFGMLIFRSSTITEAFQIVCSIFMNTSKAIMDLGLSIPELILLFICILVLYFVDYFKYHHIDLLERLEQKKLAFRWMIYFLLLFALLTFGIYGANYNPSDFIYGGF